jgi:hypothetical protein
MTNINGGARAFTTLEGFVKVREKVAQELKRWVVQSSSHSQVRGEKISPVPAKHLVIRKWSLGHPTDIYIVPTK